MVALPAKTTKRKAEDALGGEAKKFKCDYTKKAFIVHEDLLYHHAPLAESYLKPPTATRPNPHIWISGHWPDAFETYLQWLYSSDSDLARLLLAKKQDDEKHAHIHDDDFHESLTTYEWTRFWVLAHSLGDYSCCNKVIDVLLEAAGDGTILVHSGHVEAALGGTEDGSALRKWVVDEYIGGATVKSFCEDEGRLPEGFENLALRRVLGKKAAGEELVKPIRKDASQYHIHAAGEARCA